MRNGLRLLLERQPNLSVVGEAADGREAVEMAAAEKPDVVVMDIAMPHLNGVEAARQIVNFYGQRVKVRNQKSGEADVAAGA